MQVEPVVLEGHKLRLEPLSVEHAADLLEVATPETFNYSNIRPPEFTVQGFEDYILRSLQMPDRRAFTMVLQENGKAIGTTSYHDIRPQHRGLAVGWTWIGKTYQGTFVNPESKYLMLRHAFETLGVARVQFQADARNTHSLNAIEKLGATREGTLRKHIVLPDGYIRDSVVFSIIADEWPEIKRQLQERLGYIP